MSRAFNFSAGPSALPQAVLERAAAELLKAFTVSPTPPEAKPLVLERIG